MREAEEAVEMNSTEKEKEGDLTSIIYQHGAKCSMVEINRDRGKLKW